MGFYINNVTINSYGVTLNNAYVTIKGTYYQIKRGAPSNIGHPALFNSDNPYSLYAKYYIYADKSDLLQHLHVDECIVYLPQISETPIQDIYTKIQELYPDKIITNDI